MWNTWAQTQRVDMRSQEKQSLKRTPQLRCVRFFSHVHMVTNFTWIGGYLNWATWRFMMVLVFSIAMLLVCAGSQVWSRSSDWSNSDWSEGVWIDNGTGSRSDHFTAQQRPLLWVCEYLYSSLLIVWIPYFLEIYPCHFRPSNAPEMLTRQLTKHSLCFSLRVLEWTVKED